jgi:hypothetical protein
MITELSPFGFDKLPLLVVGEFADANDLEGAVGIVTADVGARTLRRFLSIRRRTARSD